MSKIISPLSVGNSRQAQGWANDASERNNELFFGISVNVNTKDFVLHYESSAGIDRIIETMRHALNALENANRKAKK